MIPDQVAGILRSHYNAEPRGTAAAVVIESLVMDLSLLTDDPRWFHLKALGHIDAYLGQIDVENARAEEAAREAELRPKDWS